MNMIVGTAAMTAALCVVNAGKAFSGPDPIHTVIEACCTTKQALYAIEDSPQAESLATALNDLYGKFDATDPTTLEGVLAKLVFAPQVLDRNPDVFDREAMVSRLTMVAEGLMAA